MKLICKITVFILLLSSCANMVAPTGGLKDITAPKVLNILEKETAILTEFHFIFDEYNQTETLAYSIIFNVLFYNLLYFLLRKKLFKNK